MMKPSGTTICLAFSALALALASSAPRWLSSPVAQGFLPAVALAQAGSPAWRRLAKLPPPCSSKYCITCHNEKRKTAGLMIDKLDLQHVGEDAEVWEKVARKFRTQEMPPPGAPRPDKATYTAVTTHLENALDAAAAAHPNPGRVAVHRLNRAEYTNAIRDLLDLDIDGRTLLSTDDAEQEGFDNVASVLDRVAGSARELSDGRAHDQPPCGRGHRAQAVDRQLQGRTVDGCRTIG